MEDHRLYKQKHRVLLQESKDETLLSMGLTHFMKNMNYWDGAEEIYLNYAWMPGMDWINQGCFPRKSESYEDM